MPDYLTEKYVITKGADEMWDVRHDDKNIHKAEYLGDAIEWLFFEEEVAQIVGNTDRVTIEITYAKPTAALPQEDR